MAIKIKEETRGEFTAAEGGEVTCTVGSGMSRAPMLDDILRHRYPEVSSIQTITPPITGSERENMTVYLVGRMRGIPYYNFPLFDKVRTALTKAGFQVISPADLDRDVGFDAMNLPPDSDWNALPENFSLEACIRRDVDAALRCNIVLILSRDWDVSSGSRAEIAVVKWAMKPVYLMWRNGCTHVSPFPAGEPDELAQRLQDALQSIGGRP